MDRAGKILATVALIVLVLLFTMTVAYLIFAIWKGNFIASFWLGVGVVGIICALVVVRKIGSKSGNKVYR